MGYDAQKLEVYVFLILVVTILQIFILMYSYNNLILHFIFMYDPKSPKSLFAYNLNIKYCLQGIIKSTFRKLYNFY